MWLGWKLVSIPISRWLEDAESGLTDWFWSCLQELRNELLRLDQRSEALDAEIEHISYIHPEAKCLKQLPGVGPLVSMAWVARFGGGRHFKRGRHSAVAARCSFFDRALREWRLRDYGAEAWPPALKNQPDRDRLTSGNFRDRVRYRHDTRSQNPCINANQKSLKATSRSIRHFDYPVVGFLSPRESHRDN